MSEPSERAIWNVRMLANFSVLFAYMSLLGYGVFTQKISVTDALALIGSTALGGGIGWLSK